MSYTIEERPLTDEQRERLEKKHLRSKRSIRKIVMYELLFTVVAGWFYFTESGQKPEVVLGIYGILTLTMVVVGAFSYMQDRKLGQRLAEGTIQMLTGTLTDKRSSYNRDRAEERNTADPAYRHYFKFDEYEVRTDGYNTDQFEIGDLLELEENLDQVNDRMSPFDMGRMKRLKPKAENPEFTW